MIQILQTGIEIGKKMSQGNRMLECPETFHEVWSLQEPLLHVSGVNRKLSRVPFAYNRIIKNQDFLNVWFWISEIFSYKRLLHLSDFCI